MPPSADQLRREARALYATGMSPEAIGLAIGRSPSSVYRWMKADGDWDDPAALLAILDARLAALVDDQELAADAGAWADAIQKISNVRDRIASRLENLPTVLGVLSRFAEWARDDPGVSDEEMRILFGIHEYTPAWRAQETSGPVASGQRQRCERKRQPGQRSSAFCRSLWREGGCRVAACERSPRRFEGLSFRPNPSSRGADRGLREIVELLLAKGTDLSAKDRSKRTPLHLAVSSGHEEVAALLLARGTDLNENYWAGRTLLHSAASSEHKGVVELVLAKGADANATDEVGMIPLHLAVSSGRKEVVDLLLAKGADVNARDHEGRTALDLAEEEGDLATVQILLRHGAKESAGSTPEEGSEDEQKQESRE